MDVKDELQDVLQECYGVINDLQKTEGDMTRMKKELSKNISHTKEKVKDLCTGLYTAVQSFQHQAESHIDTIIKSKTETLDRHSNELVQCLEYLSKMCVISEDLLSKLKIKHKQSSINPEFAPKLKTQLLHVLDECKELRLIDYGMFISLDAEIDVSGLSSTPLVSMHLVSRGSQSDEQSNLCSVAFMDSESLMNFQVGPSLVKHGMEHDSGVHSPPQSPKEEEHAKVLRSGRILSIVPEEEEDVSSSASGESPRKDVTSESPQKKIVAVNHTCTTSSPAHTAGGDFAESDQNVSIKQELEDPGLSAENPESVSITEPVSRDQMQVRADHMAKTSEQEKCSSTYERVAACDLKVSTSSSEINVNTVSESKSSPVKVNSTPLHEVNLNDMSLTQLKPGEGPQRKSAIDVNLPKVEGNKILQRRDGKMVQEVTQKPKETVGSPPNKHTNTEGDSIRSATHATEKQNTFAKGKDGLAEERDVLTSRSESNKKYVPAPALPVTKQAVSKRAEHVEDENCRPQLTRGSSQNASHCSASSRLPPTVSQNSELKLAKHATTKFDIRSKFVWPHNGNAEVEAQLLHTITGGSSTRFDFPIGCCTLSNGQIVVADTGNNLVKIMQDNDLRKTIGKKDGVTFLRPSAVAADSQDNIYVKDDQRLQIFNVAGKLLKSVGSHTFRNPYGLALIDVPQRGLAALVLDVGANSSKLHRYLVAEDKLQSCHYEPLKRYGSHNSKLRFFAVHKETMLASDLGASTMYLSHINGQAIGCFGNYGRSLGEFVEPSGVAVDAVGNWLIGDSKNNRVQIFSNSSSFLATIKFSHPIRRPSGLHLTPDGVLYVNNFLDQCIKVYRLVGR